MNDVARYSLALIGARGYTGRELLSLLVGHPRLELALAVSGSQAGAPLVEEVPGWPDEDQRFEALEPDVIVVTGDHSTPAAMKTSPSPA